MTEYAKLVLAVDSTQAKSAQDDMKGLQSEGDKAEQSVAALGKAATIAGEAIAAAAAATVAMIASSVQAADAAGEAAASAGLSAEEFTRLKYAMQFDGSPEQLGQSMLFLNKTIADAPEKLNALGVALKNQDGTMRSSHDVMLSVADKFAGMKDGAQKAALAVDIFGRSGDDMVPFLNNGAAGIASLEAEADRLGVTINGETVAAAGHLKDNFDRLKSAGYGFANQIMIAMLPALNGLGDEMVDASGKTSTLASAAQPLVIILKALLTVGVALAAAFQVVGNVIAGVAATLDAMDSRDYKRAWQTFGKTAYDAVSSVSGAVDRIGNIWTESALSVSTAESIKRSEMSATTEAALAAAEEQKRIADAAAVAAQKKAAAEAAAAAKKAANAPVEHGYGISVTEFDGGASGKAAADKKYAELQAQFASERELEVLHYNQKLLDYQQYALMKGQSTAETNAYIEQMTTDHNAKLETLERNTAQAKTLTVAGYLGDIAGTFASQSKTMLIAQKAAAMPAAFMAIQTGMAQALALPFPANLGAFAKVASIGKGVYDSIKSVGGGGGGGPSIGSSKGSMSLGSSAAPTVAAPAAVARQQVTDIRLTGIRPDDMITGAYLQKIIAGIGETLADNGGRMGRVDLVMSA